MSTKYFFALAVVVTSVACQAQDSIDARAAAQLARDTAARQPAPILSEPSREPVVLAPLPERPAQLDLIAIKGFKDRLEAVVGVNGRRATATLRTPLLPEGWRLIKLGPECAEVQKPAGKQPEMRTLCFIAPGPAPITPSPTNGGGARGASVPLPPGVPAAR